MLDGLVEGMLLKTSGLLFEQKEPSLSTAAFSIFSREIRRLPASPQVRPLYFHND
jgi:hypothetical protein